MFVEKSGQVDTVILSLAQYQALKASHNTKRLAARKKAFEAEFAAWIDAQNAWVQAYGVPGSDMRPW